MRTQRLRRRVRFLVREFAPPYKASDAEAAEQCFDPIAHGSEVQSESGYTFLLRWMFSWCGYVRWVRFRRGHSNKKTPLTWGVRFIGDSYGNRTHVFSVRGWCLNRLTNEPFFCIARLLYNKIVYLSIEKSKKSEKYFKASETVTECWNTAFNYKREQSAFYCNI